MTYDKSEVLKMLDKDTLTALMKIYGVTLQHLALRFRCTRQNVGLLIKNDSLKEYQKEIILELFINRGLEVAELMLLHQMTSKSKKLKAVK